MSTIPSVFDLKGQARAIQTQHSCKLSVAYQILAAQHGFRDWAALSSAAKKTGDAANNDQDHDGVGSRSEVPSEVIQWLKTFKEEFKASPSEIKAFQSGLIFGYDPKEAHEFRFDELFIDSGNNGLNTLTADDLVPLIWKNFIEDYENDFQENQRSLVKRKQLKDLPSSTVNDVSL